MLSRTYRRLATFASHSPSSTVTRHPSFASKQVFFPIATKRSLTIVPSVESVLFSTLQAQQQHDKIVELYAFMQQSNARAVTPKLTSLYLISLLHNTENEKIILERVDQLCARFQDTPEVLHETESFLLYELLIYHVAQLNVAAAKATFIAMATKKLCRDVAPFNILLELYANVCYKIAEHKYLEFRKNNSDKQVMPPTPAEIAKGKEIDLLNATDWYEESLRVVEHLNNSNIELSLDSYRQLLKCLWHSDKVAHDKKAVETKHYLTIMENKKISCPLEIMSSSAEVFSRARQTNWVTAAYEYTINEITIQANGFKMTSDAEKQLVKLFITAADSYSRIGNTDKINELIAAVDKLKIKPLIQVYISLIRSYLVKMKPEQAEEILKLEIVKRSSGSIHPSLVMFHMIIGHYLHRGQYDQAERLLQEVKSMQIMTDTILYDSFLAHYAQHGLTDMLEGIVKQIEKEQWMQDLNVQTNFNNSNNLNATLKQ